MTEDPRARLRGLIVLVGLWIVAGLAGRSQAQEKSPIPEYTGDRVYVARDVPGSYQILSQAIKELERSSPQTYFVVVIRSAGQEADAATRYVEDLYDTWRTQAQAKGLKLDPERSVITLVALDNRRVAVHQGSALRDRYGLSKQAVNSLISSTFAPLARDQKYPEAVASLLAGIQNQVAKQDKQTAEIKTGTALFPAVPSSVAAATVPPSALVPAADDSRQQSPRVPSSQPAQSGTQAASSGAAASPFPRQMFWALLASLLAVGLIVAGLIWLARNRARNSVTSKIKEYKKKAVDVMDKLDNLKARLKQLPTEDPDFKEPMAGDTLAVYEQTQSQLTGLWDRWLEVMDVLDKAQALAKKDTALGTQKLKEAEQLVSDSKVFEQIEEQSKACAASMDRLNHAHETARSTVDVVVASQKEIETRVEKVQKEGLPTIPYRPEIDGIAAEAQKAKEILTPDPIGAKQTLDKAQDRAMTLRDRVEQILDRYADGRKITASLVTLGQQVASHRNEGLRLDEDGGNPDHPIAQTFQTLEALRKAVHEGDPKTALEQLQLAQTLQRQAEQTLDGVLKARDLCAKDQPERARETRRLREALGQYEAFEAELKRDFAPSSWQAVAGNLAQARGLLETFDGKTDEAAAASTTTAQKYLLGARLLSQVSQEQQAVFQLLSGVGDQLAALKAVRQECQTAMQSLDEREHATERYFRQNEQAIGGMARGTFASAQKSRQEIASLASESRPDWPRIRQVLARTLEEYAIARNQAEADVQTYQQLSSEFEQVRQEAGRVRAFLAGHEEDRLAANQHYQNAETALGQVQAESARSAGEWARWLEMVRGAAADLAHSDRLAREDIRLARQAESEIQEAARTLRKARAYFSMGVTLGTVNAESQVAEADRLYRSQNYEQAIRTAADAIHQVRQAQAIAAQQVFIRQMTIEANRRMMSPPMGGAFQSVGGVSSGTPAAWQPAGGKPAEAGTAAGSWSSETAEGGW